MVLGLSSPRCLPVSFYRVWLTSALVFGVSLLGLGGPPKAQASEPGSTLHHFELAQGQQLLVNENHQQPIVTIDTWLPVGSVMETPQTNGISHFLEHLLFKSTALYPEVGALDQLLDKRGATYNAGTSQDFTHYYITVATPYVEEALKAHASQLCQGLIPAEELEKERAVVLEEMNRSADNPIRLLLEATQQAVYGQHGYAQRTLGPRSVIETVPRERILDYYQRWYRPEQFVTVLSGDITAPEAKRLTQAAFSPCLTSTPADPLPQLEPAPWPAQPTVQLLEQTGRQKSYALLSLPAPSIANWKTALALDVLAQRLGGDESALLVQQVRNKARLVDSISAMNMTQRYGGLFALLWSNEPEQTQASLKEVLQVLQQFKNTGLSAPEVQAIKAQLRRDYQFVQEASASVASAIGYYASLGDKEGYTRYLERLDSLTAAEVNEVLQNGLPLERASLVVLQPKGSPLLQAKADFETDTTEQLLAFTPTQSSPNPSASSPASTPPTLAFTQQSLANGLTYLQEPAATEASPSNTWALKLFVPGGKRASEKPGVAELMSALWARKTASLSEAELQKLLARNGLELSLAAQPEYLEITARSTQQDWGLLWHLLSETLQAPVWDEALLEREKALLKRAVERELEQPEALAMDQLTHLIDPRLSKQSLLEALDSVTATELEAAYSRWLQPERLIASAAGSIPPPLPTLLGNLRFSEAASSASKPQQQAAQSPTQGPASKRLTREGQAATWVVQGFPVVGLNHPDSPALKVASSILGMGMSSRLFVDLRDQQGLAYAVGSRYSPLGQEAVFSLYIGTDPANEAKVLTGFQEQLERLHNELVSESELEAAKSKLIGRFALAHESPAQRAFYPGFYETVGLGAEYDKQYAAAIEQVTAEAVQKAAQTYLSPSRLKQVVVAPAE